MTCTTGHKVSPQKAPPPPQAASIHASGSSCRGREPLVGTQYTPDHQYVLHHDSVHYPRANLTVLDHRASKPTDFTLHGVFHNTNITPPAPAPRFLKGSQTRPTRRRPGAPAAPHSTTQDGGIEPKPIARHQLQNSPENFPKTLAADSRGERHVPHARNSRILSRTHSQLRYDTWRDYMLIISITRPNRITRSHKKRTKHTSQWSLGKQTGK